MPEAFIAHSPAYRRRRFLNWFPMGLTYAFLYMGRYNLTVSKGAFENLAGSGRPLYALSNMPAEIWPEVRAAFPASTRPRMYPVTWSSLSSSPATGWRCPGIKHSI